MSTTEKEVKRLRAVEENYYNDTVKSSYENDSDRVEYDKAIRDANRAEAIGYYASKAISGYLIGYAIGVVLGCLFVYYFMIEPFVLPILRYIFK